MHDGLSLVSIGLAHRRAVRRVEVIWTCRDVIALIIVVLVIMVNPFYISYIGGTDLRNICFIGPQQSMNR